MLEQKISKVGRHIIKINIRADRTSNIGLHKGGKRLIPEFIYGRTTRRIRATVILPITSEGLSILQTNWRH